jgi:hypothetical protein
MGLKDKIKKISGAVVRGLREFDKALDRAGFRARINPIDLATGKVGTPFGPPTKAPPIKLSEETQKFLELNGYEKTAKMIGDKLKLNEMQVLDLKERLKNYMVDKYGKWW